MITTLLLREEERSGQIDLRQFYFRRTFRIFPPYYIYLAVAAMVAWVASRPIPLMAVTAAASYTSDYYPYGWIHPFLASWYVLHTWSLSVEEQFYLVWPFVLCRISKRAAAFSCMLAILSAPLLRWCTVTYLPVYAAANQWFRLFHTEVDTLAMGCLLAFVFRSGAQRERIERCLQPFVALCATVYLIAFARLFDHLQAAMSALCIISIANICLLYLIAYAVLRPSSLFGRLLNSSVARHVGLISYSLYLWQQLFLGPYAHFKWFASLLMVLLCAEASFWLIERPSLRLRSRLEHRLFIPKVRM